MNIAINGFGRIGRTFLRSALKNGLQVNAINDLADPRTLAHLFKYDSVHGPYHGQVSHTDTSILIDGKEIQVYSQKDAALLPWGELGIDIVLESTGKFLSSELAGAHIQAGAKQVVLSAPPSDDTPMVVLGVNDEQVDLSLPFLSCASCTTNNIAPIIKVLHEGWEVADGYITTVHSMTGDQNLHDGPHKDLRRARAASSSIVPTTTGAAKAITRIFPGLENKLGGAGIRVPVLNGSLTDLTCTLKRPADVVSINAAFKKASESSMAGILSYTEDPIVSVDIIKNTGMCVIDDIY